MRLQVREDVDLGAVLAREPRPLRRLFLLEEGLLDPAVDAGIKAAMEADAAKEAAAAAAAADAAGAQPVVFKKRKGGTGGFRRKATDDALRDL